MNIYLGNMSIEDMENRLKVNFPIELTEWMRPRKQDNATNIQPGKWHCFDIPFDLVCGDRETAVEIHKHLAPLSNAMATPLQISLASQKDTPKNGH